MGVTLSDIAKAVDVSPSTVSRVINGTAPISEEMKKKIYKAMDELNYHPNSLARNLATGSSSTIGLILDATNEAAFSNSFFTRGVYAIERILQKNGYSLLITNNKGNKNSPVCDMIYGKRIDGLIVPSAVLSISLINVLKDQNTPWVVLGESTYTDEKICWIDLDNYQGGKKAVQHLLQMGYKNIVFVADNAEATFTTRRLAGFKDAMEENNLAISQKQVLFFNDNYAELEEKIIQNTKLGNGPDAYLCTNNILAYHVLCALRKTNLSIPKDVGVITFDNYPIAEFMDPPLTVIDADTYRLGETAAQLLINMLRKKETPNPVNLVSMDLIERHSTNKSLN